MWRRKEPGSWGGKTVAQRLVFESLNHLEDEWAMPILPCRKHQWRRLVARNNLWNEYDVLKRCSDMLPAQRRSQRNIEHFMKDMEKEQCKARKWYIHLSLSCLVIFSTHPETSFQLFWITTGLKALEIINKLLNTFAALINSNVF